MKISERNRNRYGSGLLRLGIYAIIFTLTLVPLIIEIKTGIPIGRGRGSRASHDSRSWDEVWTELLEPDRLPMYLAIFMVLIVVAELYFRSGKTQEDEDEEAKDQLEDSPAKPFTML